MRPLSEIEQLAQAIFARDAAADPSRLPKELSFLVASVGKTVAQHHSDITQGDFIYSVISRLEDMQAIDDAIKRP